MLGLGERKRKCCWRWKICAVRVAIFLRSASNLQPTLKHLPVVEFVSPAKFEESAGGQGSWVLFTSPAPDGAQLISRGRVQPAVSASVKNHGG